MTALSFSPDGRQLAFADSMTVRICSADDGAEQMSLSEAFGGWFGALVFSPTGRTLAAGGGELDTIGLWDPRTGELRDELDDVGGWIDSLAFSPNGACLAAGTWTGILVVWDLQRGTRTSAKAHSGIVGALSWSPDGSLLGSAGALLPDGPGDLELRLWDASTLAPADTLTQRGRASALAFSNEGVLAAGSDGHVQLWEGTRELGKVQTSGTVTTLAWAPNGALLACGTTDKRVELVDPTRRASIASAHCLAPVQELRFGTDGRTLQAADSGAATGGRPVPYAFELCNMPSGAAAARG